MSTLDSGNTWKSAISEETMHILGFNHNDLISVTGVTLGTAHAHTKLEVMGILQGKIMLTVGNNKEEFAFNPIVIKNLSMAVNISKQFMVENEWDQLHSRNAVRISGRMHKMVSKNEAPRIGVYALEEITIEPDKVTTVQCKHEMAVSPRNHGPLTSKQQRRIN